MVVNRNNTGAVITVASSGAVAPFSYIAGLKFDALGRLVVLAI
jgi:hypothetical protein